MQYDNEKNQLNAIIALKRELKAKGVDFPSERGIRDSDIVDRNSANNPKMGSVSSGGVVVHGNESSWRQNRNGQSSRSGMGPQVSVRNPVPAVLSMDQPERGYIGQNQSLSNPPGGSGDPGIMTTSSSQNPEKLKKEIKHVKANVNMLNELIDQFSISSHTLDNDDKTLLQDLADTCKEMQDRIVNLIPTIVDEVAMIELVDVNDEVLAVLKLHKEFIARKEAEPSGSVGLSNFPIAGESPYQESTAAANRNVKESVDDLINFDDFGPTTTLATTASNIQSTSAQPVSTTEADPFGLNDINFNAVTISNSQANQHPLPPTQPPPMITQPINHPVAPSYQESFGHSETAPTSVISDFPTGSTNTNSQMFNNSNQHNSQIAMPTGSSNFGTSTSQFSALDDFPTGSSFGMQPSIPPRSGQNQFNDWMSSQNFPQTTISDNTNANNTNSNVINVSNLNSFGESAIQSGPNEYNMNGKNSKNSVNVNTSNANPNDINNFGDFNFLASNNNSNNNGFGKNTDTSISVNQRLTEDFSEFLSSSANNNNQNASTSQNFKSEF